MRFTVVFLSFVYIVVCLIADDTVRLLVCGIILAIIQVEARRDICYVIRRIQDTLPLRITIPQPRLLPLDLALLITWLGSIYYSSAFIGIIAVWVILAWSIHSIRSDAARALAISPDAAYHRRCQKACRAQSPLPDREPLSASD